MKGVRFPIKGIKKYWTLILVLVLVVLANVLVQLRVFRWDLTDDRIYSLSEASKELLRKTDAPVEVTLLLEGELNSGFRRLRKAAKETLEEMNVYGDIRCLSYDKEVLTADSLYQLGIQPLVIHEREHNGKTAQTIVYPFALIQYKDRLTVVSLLKNTRGLSGEENLNASIEQLEYAFMDALQRLHRTSVPSVAILEGHGEPAEIYTFDLMTALNEYFQVDRGSITSLPSPISSHILDPYKAIIVAGPRTAFSDAERFIIDQYIMRGGAVLWAVDGVRYEEEMLQKQGTSPLVAHDLGLTEMLFKYGVRIDPALVQDVQCLTIPVNTSNDPDNPNLQPVPWTYAPLLLTSQGSPITRDLGQIMSTFVSPIDAVGGEDGIEKRILLATSTATRVTATPGEVDLNDINPDLSNFQYQYVPVAVSLEGMFTSAYAHRMVPEGVETDEPVRKVGVKTRQVVIGSGSVLLNETHQRQPLPMGYDRYNGIQFSNRDFVVNALLWLTDSEGVISLREKIVPLRLLNSQRAYAERTKLELISTISPIVFLMIIGGCVFVIRKVRYTRKKKVKNI